MVFFFFFLCDCDHESLSLYISVCMWVCVCVLRPHPVRSSPRSRRGAGRPAGPGRRWARRGWAGWCRSTVSCGAWWPWTSHLGTAPCSTRSTARCAWPALLVEKCGSYVLTEESGKAICSFRNNWRLFKGHIPNHFSPFRPITISRNDYFSKTLKICMNQMTLSLAFTAFH